jgi:hypothetical protein
LQPDYLTSSDLEAIAAEPYEHRGILHSEMALILHTCRRMGIEAVIESGRARAQSAYLLAKYLPKVRIYSIDGRIGKDQIFGIKRVQDLPNVTLVYGDGRRDAPILARKLKKRLAVLCDGPKGADAIKLVQKCFAYPNVLVGFIHDMRRLDNGQPSPHRAAALAAFPKAKFSDDRRLCGFNWLDEAVAKADGPCGPAHEQEFGSYGPTVGVFINPNATF